MSLGGAAGPDGGAPYCDAGTPESGYPSCFWKNINKKSGFLVKILKSLVFKGF